MFHGVADLALRQVMTAAFLASLMVSVGDHQLFSDLALRAGARGRLDRAARAARSRLFLGRGVSLRVRRNRLHRISLFHLLFHDATPDASTAAECIGGFLFYAFCGWLLGLLVVMIFFLGALRFAKPENDDALEVFAFPAFLIIRKIFGGHWIRSFKDGTRSEAAPGSYAAHDGFFSRLIARLGPGYGSEPTPGHPPVLHSGHRFVMIVMFIFLALLLDYRSRAPCMNCATYMSGEAAALPTRCWISCCCS